MLKRAADWLEKMSVGALVVGLFQQESLTALLFGAACLLGCFCITLVQEEKTVMAWIFVGGVCFLVFASAFSVAIYQAIHKKQEAAQPKPAAEEVMPRRPDVHGAADAVPLSPEMLQRVEEVSSALKKEPQAPAEEAAIEYFRRGVSGVRPLLDTHPSHPRIARQDITALIRERMEGKGRPGAPYNPWVGYVIDRKDYDAVLHWMVIDTKGVLTPLFFSPGRTKGTAAPDDEALAKARA